MTNFRITHDDKEVAKLMSELVARINNTSVAMNAVALEMSRSISKNFQVGGRYSSPEEILGGENKWKPLSKVTVDAKKRKRREDPYKILHDSGQLVNSISTKHGKDFAEVGTNKVYAAAQHFGRPAGLEALVGAHVRHIKELGRTFGKKSGKLGKEKWLKRSVSVRQAFEGLN